MLTIIQGKGTLPREEAGRNINYDNKSLSNYKQVKKGDFIIHLRSFEGGLEMANELGIVSPAYTILRNKKTISNGFYREYFHTDEFINHILAKSVEGIRDGRQINYNTFKLLKIPYCNIAEQEKISRLFSILNKRIEKQKQLVNAIKKYKRGLSNKLFEDYSNNWTAANFVDVFKILQNNTFSRAELTFEKTEILNIHYGDVLIKYGDILDLSRACDIPFIKNNIDLKRYSETSYLKNGDVVIADTAEDYTVGKTIEIFSASGKRMLAGLHTIPCRPLIPFEAKYLGYYLNSYNFRKQILPLIQGTKVSSISKSELQKVKVKYPEQKEQKRIVSILSLIDEKIYIAEHQLTALKICKNGLLQQLFI